MRNLPCKRIEVDEIWTFANMRQKHVPDELHGVFGYGDVYTFHGLCANSKVMVGWVIGRRDFETAAKFMDDLASRLASRVQLTTDGFRSFLDAVDWSFGTEIDYAQLIKLYGSDRGPDSDRMYASAKVIRTEKHIVSGDPSISNVSTSYVEHQNLNLRMGMRRLTRLTNAFTRKVANLDHALAIHVMNHNFVRKHRTLKTTPAMALGIADHMWTIEEIVDLFDSEARGVK